jgi:hypothetical protein
MPVILKNNASSTLAAAVTTSDTGIVVVNGSQFPTISAGDYFYATLVSQAGTTEIVKVTARVDNSMTVVRAQDGSLAASFQVGALVEMRINAATVSVANMAYSQGGTSAVTRTVQSRLQDYISVKDFGAVGDGITDDTAAFNAAIAALPADGGTIYVPSANYRLNLTITKSGVTLQGETNSRHRGDANKIGLRPFNLALPVITVGNDSAYVEHVGLQDISIVDNSGSGAQVGLRLAGGTYAFYSNNLMIAGFQKYCLHIQGGGAYPIAYVYFSNFSFQHGSFGAAADATIYTRYGSQYTTAMFFVNGRVSSGFGGSERLFLNDSCRPSMVNVWCEAAGTRRGFRILQTDVAPGAYFECQNVMMDTGSSSDILLENGINASLVMGDFLRGQINFDGLIENNAATTAVLSGAQVYGLVSQFDTFRSRISTFPDASNPTDETAKISGAGSVGARRLSLNGDRIDLSPGATNYVRLNSAAGTSTATFELLDQLNNRAARVVNDAGELQLTPPAGYAVRVGDGAWNGRPLRLGSWYLWVDATGDLRIKSGAPTSDLDGTVVGTQT